MRTAMRLISGALFGLLVLGVVRSFVVAVTAPAALVSWLVYTPVALVVQMTTSRRPLRSLNYFVKYPIVTFDVLLERIFLRSDDEAELSDWPWVDDTELRTWRLRRLIA